MNTILVTRADLANNLLDKGFSISHLGRNKYNPNSTVFYFKNEGNIKEEINVFLKKIYPNR